MAEAAAELGFDGVDLTVRPKGHVEPDRAEDDLPMAVEAIKAAGLVTRMMASNIDNADDATSRKVLRSAADSGIELYRLKYFSFRDDQNIPEQIKRFNVQLKELAALNREIGITGAYQNHSGTRFGAEIWEIFHALDGINPEDVGCQYDIRHAVAEGGYSWETGLRLIHKHINCIVLKDFIWKKVDGKWKIINVPLGEGMVDFEKYFQWLKKLDIHVPVSIHYEYDLEGVEHGAKELDVSKHESVFRAMRRDLQWAKDQWNAV